MDELRSYMFDFACQSRQRRLCLALARVHMTGYSDRFNWFLFVAGPCSPTRRACLVKAVQYWLLACPVDTIDLCFSLAPVRRPAAQKCTVRKPSRKNRKPAKTIPKTGCKTGHFPRKPEIYI